MSYEKQFQANTVTPDGTILNLDLATPTPLIVPTSPVPADCSGLARAMFVVGWDGANADWMLAPNQKRAIVATAVDAAYDPGDAVLVKVDTTAGDITITLNQPASCDPIDIHIKKATLDANNVIVSPNGADTVEGQATHTFNGVAGGGLFGESFHYMWDSSVSEWVIV